MLRLILSMFLVFLSHQIFAQGVNGLVVDETTKEPIANARVATADYSVLTSATGSFILKNIRMGDSVTVSHIGYESHRFRYNYGSASNTLVISLKSGVIALKEVTIAGARNYKLDSLNRRKEFAPVFAYKAPGFKDIFINKPGSMRQQYSPFQNSTSSLVGINVLSVFGLIGRNKSSVSKLQKRLLKDEENSYVDHVFSKEKIQSITSLKGDSLQNFIDIYRPSVETARDLTEYELLMYIKKSYGKFRKR